MFKVKVHLPVPEQPAPFQPAKAEFESAAAVSVTDVPGEKVLEQLFTGQSMPAGLLVILPLPVPVTSTTSRGSLLKAVVTCLSESMSRTHEPVPVQAPLQPENKD